MISEVGEVLVKLAGLQAALTGIFLEMMVLGLSIIGILFLIAYNVNQLRKEK